MYDIHGNPTHLDSMIDEGNPYYEDDDDEEPEYCCENCGDHGCHLCETDIPKRKGK